MEVGFKVAGVKMKAKIVVCFSVFLLLIGLGMPVEARESGSAYVSVLYNELNGLPTGEANVILQTDDGYIWIGSYGGLVRYDGSTFRNFSYEGTLQSSSVRSLYEDSKGRLWVGTNDAGLFLYENGAFRRILCKEDHSYLCIRYITEDANGTIYAASNSGVGIVKDDMLLPLEIPEVKGYTVYALGTDSYNRVWCALDGGKCAIISQDKLQGILDSELFFDGGADVYSLTADEAGNIYLGSSEKVLAKVEMNSENLDAFAFQITHIDMGVTTHNQVTVSGEGDILVAGLDGVAWYQNGELKVFDETDYAVSVNNVIKDYEGSIWLASSSYGVVKFSTGCYTSPNDLAGLEGQALNTIAGDTGYYYIGTDQGIMVFNKRWQPIENRLTQTLSGVRVRHIICDSNGNIWVANYSDKGVICYNSKNDTLVGYSEEDGLISSRVRVLYELSDGSIVAGTQGGISVIKNGKITENYDQNDGMETTSVLCFLEGSDGTLYAGSDGSGIYAIKDGKVSVHGFEEGLGEGVVLRMLANADGSGIFVSAGSSLYYWENGAFRKLDNFRKQAGSIFDFYDRDGLLWLMQNSGVLAVDKAVLLSGEEASVKTYGFAYGLTGSLNANVWNYVTEDGSIYLSTRSGVSVFGFKGVDSGLPMGAINSIQVDDTIYEHPTELKLASNVQRITIDCAMLSYTGTSDCKMVYWLEGFDDEETILEVGKSRTISYTNLPGGDYTFHLKVYDPESGEEGDVREYRVEIHKNKRLVEHPLFWAICVLLSVCAIGGLSILIARRKVEVMKKRQEEYQAIIDQSMETFAKIIDVKDPDTSGHSLRVAQYSREIAKKMGMSEEEQKRIYYMAMLHDIGKIGLPDAILHKEGALTDEERRIVQTHPVAGGDILKTFTALEGIEDGARYHHERYDGNGYCGKKKGEEIPLIARIIGVADSFDAMSSDRCYRKALSKEKILDELQKGKGTQFDPEIVEIMLKMLEEGRFLK